MTNWNSNEQRTENREQRTENREQRTENREECFQNITLPSTYNLRPVKDIHESDVALKDLRSEIHSVVLAFRQFNDIDRNTSLDQIYTKKYLEEINKWATSIDQLSEDSAQRIVAVTTPENYNRIRQCARMRAYSQSEISENLMNNLCLEIKAAFCWIHLIRNRE